MQRPSYQAFTETETVQHPAAWDTLSGPTVIRRFEGTVTPYGAVPGAVPFQQAQSGGADIAPLLAHIRQSYRDVQATVDEFPSYSIAVVEARAHPAERDLAYYDARTVGLAVIVVLALAVVIAHAAFTWLARRELGRLLDRMQRTGLAASGRTPPRDEPR